MGDSFTSTPSSTSYTNSPLEFTRAHGQNQHRKICSTETMWRGFCDICTIPCFASNFLFPCSWGIKTRNI
ncbi:hypothetical protein BDV38DRAFT_262398 [Aspergillus pseudotamarii]|uniref:Uncharacterized protein n=1 Tax=Aspergillus pseudotamarii TaxID=132259 RepID=A0A5N6SDV6_ASPPS|nr:uncharacterized protein BDV38DRAFT_262398 [Aspergillus pseudotamarii]KAE8132039.1 hypothetical protein BDV38DRAFT_262398 [Aspergillus pseudotamarii]